MPLSESFPSILYKSKPIEQNFIMTYYCYSLFYPIHILIKSYIKQKFNKGLIANTILFKKNQEINYIELILVIDNRVNL